MKMKSLRFLLCSSALIWTFGQISRAQDIKFERDRHRGILETVVNDVKKNYYDQTFHGINLDERFKNADSKIKEATSIGQMSGIIAQLYPNRSGLRKIQKFGAIKPGAWHPRSSQTIFG